MHSHALPCKPDPRVADIGRRLARQAELITAPLRQARQRPAEPWAGPIGARLDPGRAPEESYRDYIFRQSIWP
jgi:hypothetical protein